MPADLIGALDGGSPYTGVPPQQVMARVAESIGRAAYTRFVDRIREAVASFRPTGLIVTDAAGAEQRIYGAFSALSDDDGTTWHTCKPLSIPGPERMVRCYLCVGQCLMTTSTPRSAAT